MTKKQVDVIVGKNIRQARLARGLSVQELASLLGQSAGFIALIERGERGLTNVNLLKLANIFSQTTDSFFSSVQKPYFNETQEFQKKIFSLTADFTKAELDLMLITARGIRKLNRV